MAHGSKIPGYATGANSTYRPSIDLPVVCSIHARSMPVREEPWLSVAPPSSSRFLQQQITFRDAPVPVLY
ncbi:unnamed protein product [Rotaria socialis]|uniref:Uncharacterized protein n=1 Tax=Rotaria socialis TaxID=392032 RepID=A0A821TZK9_9BILA|nr:unnamed protein product [Rotaria socialis]